MESKPEVSGAGGEKQAQGGPRRLILWCLPRTASTALAKCLSHLDDDTEVWFEPFTFCRMTSAVAKMRNGVLLPKDYTGHEELFSTVANHLKLQRKLKFDIDPRLLSYEGVKDAIDKSQQGTIVVKAMAVAGYQNYQYFPKGFRCILIIRDPYKVIPSFRRALVQQKGSVSADVDLEKLHVAYPTLHWYGEMYELWKHLKATYDHDPVIIDSDDLLSDPAPYLKKICDVIEVPYRDDLLTWDASTDNMAKRWRHALNDTSDSFIPASSPFFQRAFASSCFVPADPAKPTPDELPPDCARIIGKCVDKYQEMFAQRYIPDKLE